MLRPTSKHNRDESNATLSCVLALIHVCFQGVEDYYTDPQIHSEDGEGFGTGNMGMEGVTRFFDTHKCNLICKVRVCSESMLISASLFARSAVARHPQMQPCQYLS
eukprot:2440406-Rhodomonas_salina.1